MSGFIINVVSDSFTGPGGDMTIYQYLYSYSIHHFFGKNIGDGWFLRGDLGISKFSLNIDTTTLKYSDDTNTGTGALFGGGYAIPASPEARVLFGAYLTSRKAEEEQMTSVNFTAGMLF